MEKQKFVPYMLKRFLSRFITLLIIVAIVVALIVLLMNYAPFTGGGPLLRACDC